MTRAVRRYTAVERGIQKVVRTYPEGSKKTNFRIKYADATGNVHFETVQSNSVADARAVLAERRVAVRKNQHVDAKDGRALFLDVARQWLDVKEPDLKVRTARSYHWTVESKLAPLHEVRMRDLDYDRVSRFRASPTKPKANGDRPAPSSIKRTMLVLNLICEYARKRKLIVENPCADLDAIKSRKPTQKMPTTENVERLIARLSSPTPERLDSKRRTVKARPADPRWPLLVETAAYTGLRAGELAGLQVRDLNYFTRSIRVERTVIALYGKNQAGSGLRIDTPKSEAGVRSVGNLDADLIERLRMHCAAKDPRDFVFGDRDPDGKPRPMHHGNVYRRVIKPAADELGIDMTFHGLRHHAGSLWLDLGMSIVEIAARLGHSSAAFTLRTYAHELRDDSTDYGEAIRERRAAAREEGAKTTRRIRNKNPFQPQMR